MDPRSGGGERIGVSCVRDNLCGPIQCGRRSAEFGLGGLRGFRVLPVGEEGSTVVLIRRFWDGDLPLASWGGGLIWSDSIFDESSKFRDLGP